MQTEKQYLRQGFIYKIGIRGMVFVKTPNGWMRSTVTCEELEKIEKARQASINRTVMRNVNDYKLA
jgi:hypothetical protein